MATYKGLARERERLADRLDRQLSRMILRSQKTLLESLITELSSNILFQAGSLTNNSANILAGNRIVESVFRNWVSNQGVDIAQFIGRNIFNIQDLNTRYYATFLNASEVSAVGNSVLDISLSKYGVGRGGALNPSGYLFNSVSDPSIPRRLKSIVSGRVGSGSELSKLKTDLGRVLGRSGVGLVETKLSEAIPSGMLQVDRETNTAFATDLQLNHAIYQGGLIKTSRDFCEERNNKVFTREEILRFGTSQDKFGGYTNKSAGQFQGKTKVYNPLTDIGGYNCRHFYSWISDDLAFVLRPDLKKPS